MQNYPDEPGDITWTVAIPRAASLARAIPISAACHFTGFSEFIVHPIVTLSIRISNSLMIFSPPAVHFTILNPG
jgi:hypothetical protein